MSEGRTCTLWLLISGQCWRARYGPGGCCSLEVPRVMRVEPQQRRGAGEERMNVSHHEGEERVGGVTKVLEETRFGGGGR